MFLCFWIAFGFVCYTYCGYPLLIFFLSRLRSAEQVDPDAVRQWPSVCVLIAVYNEQERVSRKVENLRALDYPADRLRFLFVSDGSTDATVERLRTSGIECVHYAERHGKAYALNVGRRQIREEIVVFTDVRQTVSPKAIKYLVASLLRPEIGAVSGELVHLDPNTKQAANIGLYWTYEKMIRKAESRFFSTAGATGALYAVRATDLVDLPPDTILDDFEMPVATLRKGLRTIFESRATIYDELQSETSGERMRKQRTLAGNFQSFARNCWMFLPVTNPIWWQFLSHKVFRLLVPYALMLVLVSSLLLGGQYRIFGLLQIAGYVTAIVGGRWRALREQRLVGFLVVFFELNWAAVVALKRFLAGEMSSRWEKT